LVLFVVVLGECGGLVLFGFVWYVWYSGVGVVWEGGGGGLCFVPGAWGAGWGGGGRCVGEGGGCELGGVSGRGLCGWGSTGRRPECPSTTRTGNRLPHKEKTCQTGMEFGKKRSRENTKSRTRTPTGTRPQKPNPKPRPEIKEEDSVSSG